MVKEYGMSSKVGQVYFSREKHNKYLNIPQGGTADYSQSTAELIDREVKEIIDRQYEKAKSILNARESVLIEGAGLLLENEKIEGAELEALMQS
jgi:cell division protease FtsH